MKSTTLAISAFIATAIASNAGTAKVVNRCSYDVYLWSINKQIGCDDNIMVTLKKGQAYSEQMYNPENTDHGGVSIKMSKTPTCGGKDITQLEYKIDGGNDTNPVNNWLDMSFVDCLTGDCPGFKDGYYLKSGNNGAEVQTSAVDNEHCPIFGVANAAQAAKVAYILPDDRQTKWCTAQADLSLYLCGAQAPSSGDESAVPSSAVPSSTAAPSSSTPSSTIALPTLIPTTISKIPSKSSSTDLALAKAAAVTPAPEPEAPHPVKTVVEYVTVSVDAPVRRHTHGRRHQRIHA